MKNKQQIAEMAEREADKLNREPNGEYQEAFIKGYQTAQEDMKQSLQDRVFNLANELALKGFGELAVIMHQIHNSLPQKP